MSRPVLRLLACLLITAGLGSIAACGGSSSSSGPQARESETTTDPVVKTAATPVASTNIAIEQKAGGRVWVVNQDNDSVSVIDPATRSRLAEIPVGAAPRSLAIARDGAVWVVSRDAATLSRIDPATLAVTAVHPLPPASQPFAVVESPKDGSLWVSLQATGEVAKVDPASGALGARIALGPNIRHLAMPAAGDRLLVSRFITPLLPGEATQTPRSEVDGVRHGGEILTVDPATGAVGAKTVLAASIKADTSTSGRGIPNYVGAVAISPDGKEAWVPSKQDNVFRGAGRINADTGLADFPLNFETTVRAISSRLTLDGTPAEDLILRIDHDNSSLASAAVWDPAGIYVIVALETSREFALVDPVFGSEVAKYPAGRAPQGVAISADGKLLAVNNFMDRTVGLYDLGELTGFDVLRQAIITWVADVPAIATEKLASAVLTGKQFFYDAADPRLALDRYMSCASCHNDGDHDGRVWDFTSFGAGPAEGLRNTIALRGRGAGSMLLHWSGNFDEIQDFEGQIRGFAGGTGLMDDALFNAGSRSQPLGDSKAGLSADLDALAAYLRSLDRYDPSPWRNADRSLTASALQGRSLFQSKGCTDCHAGPDFAATDVDPLLRLKDIGTIKPTTGTRLGGPLTGIDSPTLRDVWNTAPYLHDGSADTLADAIDAHAASTLTGGAPSAAERDALVDYLKQIGGEEVGF